MKKLLSLLLGVTLVTAPTAKAINTNTIVAGSAVAGSVLLYAAYYQCILKDRMTFYNMQKELEQKNSMRSNNTGIIRLYDWNMANYPTAGAVKAAEQLCVDALVADAMSGKIEGVDSTRYLRNNGELHYDVALGLEETLNIELTNLNDKLTQLKSHIYYPGYTIKPYFGFPGKSFVIDYCAELEDACATCNANVNDPATWNQRQETAIDAHMKRTALSTTTKFLRGYFHYGQAAELYWDIFKKRSRLQALKQALIKDTRFLTAKRNQQAAVHVTVR